jgi:hypothetical protein
MEFPPVFHLFIMFPSSPLLLPCRILLSPLLQILEWSQEVARALIAVGVPLQVELVVLLGGPPLTGGRNLGDDLALPPLGVCLFGDVAGDALLLLVVEVDGGAVLWAGVRALAVEGCGVVHAVEELDELAVGDLGWVKDDLCGLSVCCGG